MCTISKGQRLLREAHYGIYGDHYWGQKLAKKILRQGFYWLTLNQCALDYARKYDKYQFFAKVSRAPTNELTPMTSPWSFDILGIDLIGPLPTAKWTAKYVWVAIDYFTKWIKVEPLANFPQMIKFVMKNIVPRFGLLHKIIVDNSTQFESREFAKYYQDQDIIRSFFW